MIIALQEVLQFLERQRNLLKELNSGQFDKQYGKVCAKLTKVIIEYLRRINNQVTHGTQTCDIGAIKSEDTGTAGKNSFFQTSGLSCHRTRTGTVSSNLSLRSSNTYITNLPRKRKRKNLTHRTDQVISKSAATFSKENLPNSTKGNEINPALSTNPGVFVGKSIHAHYSTENTLSLMAHRDDSIKSRPTTNLLSGLKYDDNGDSTQNKKQKILSLKKDIKVGKKFACDLCRKCFTYQRDLKKHQKQVHKLKSYIMKGMSIKQIDKDALKNSENLQPKDQIPMQATGTQNLDVSTKESSADSHKDDKGIHIHEAFSNPQNMNETFKQTLQAYMKTKVNSEIDETPKLKNNSELAASTVTVEPNEISKNIVQPDLTFIGTICEETAEPMCEIISEPKLSEDNQGAVTKKEESSQSKSVINTTSTAVTRNKEKSGTKTSEMFDQPTKNLDKMPNACCFNDLTLPNTSPSPPGNPNSTLPNIGLSSNCKEFLITDKDKRRYPCDHCPKMFDKMKEAHNHILTHPEVLYYCHTCKGKMAHKRPYNRIFHFNCGYCVAQFQTSNQFLDHLNMKHPNFCVILNGYFYMIHPMCRRYITMNSPIFVCDFCPTLFFYPSRLIKHVLKFHVCSSNYICHICSTFFNSEQKLLIHFNKHKFYSCQKCHYKCMDLKRHSKENIAEIPLHQIHSPLQTEFRSLANTSNIIASVGNSDQNATSSEIYKIRDDEINEQDSNLEQYPSKVYGTGTLTNTSNSVFNSGNDLVKSGKYTYSHKDQITKCNIVSTAKQSQLKMYQICTTRECDTLNKMSSNNMTVTASNPSLQSYNSSAFQIINERPRNTISMSGQSQQKSNNIHSPLQKEFATSTLKTNSLDQIIFTAANPVHGLSALKMYKVGNGKITEHIVSSTDQKSQTKFFQIRTSLSKKSTTLKVQCGKSFDEFEIKNGKIDKVQPQHISKCVPAVQCIDTVKIPVITPKPLHLGNFNEPNKFTVSKLITPRIVTKSCNAKEDENATEKQRGKNTVEVEFCEEVIPGKNVETLSNMTQELIVELKQHVRQGCNQEILGKPNRLQRPIGHIAEQKNIMELFADKTKIQATNIQHIEDPVEAKLFPNKETSMDKLVNQISQKNTDNSKALKQASLRERSFGQVNIEPVNNKIVSQSLIKGSFTDVTEVPTEQGENVFRNSKLINLASTNKRNLEQVGLGIGFSTSASKKMETAVHTSIDNVKIDHKFHSEDQVNDARSKKVFERVRKKLSKKELKEYLAVHLQIGKNDKATPGANQSKQIAVIDQTDLDQDEDSRDNFNNDQIIVLNCNGIETATTYRDISLNLSYQPSVRLLPIDRSTFIDKRKTQFNTP